MRLFLTTILFAIAVMSGPALAEGDSEAGQVKAFTCTGCHGIAGYKNTYPTYHVPKLGGQNTSYIESALKAYRSGERQHGTMNLQAEGLSDQDIADIAAWFSGQGSGSADVSGDGPGRDKSAPCQACHGENGLAADPALYPNLGGQYGSYLEHSLKSYRDGTRANLIMAGFVANLSDQDIEDLAAWYSSQGGLEIIQR